MCQSAVIWKKREHTQGWRQPWVAGGGASRPGSGAPPAGGSTAPYCAPARLCMLLPLPSAPALLVSYHLCPCDAPALDSLLASMEVMQPEERQCCSMLQCICYPCCWAAVRGSWVWTHMLHAGQAFLMDCTGHMVQLGTGSDQHVLRCPPPQCCRSWCGCNRLAAPQARMLCCSDCMQGLQQRMHSHIIMRIADSGHPSSPHVPS